MSAVESATAEPRTTSGQSRRPLETAAWLLGMALFAGIAASSLRMLVERIGLITPEIASRQALAGLVAVTLYLVVAAVWLIAISLAARRLGARWALALGLLMTAVTRLAVSFAVDAPLVSDWLAYHADAVRFAAEGPSLGDRPPGYPALLSAGYALMGTQTWVAEALNVGLSLVTAVLGFDLLRRAGGVLVAAIGIGLYAILPSQAMLVAIVSSEATYTAALIAAVWCLSVLPGLRLGVRRRRLTPAAGVIVAAILAGILLGLSQYVRPSSLVLLPAFVIVTKRVAGVLRPRLAAIALVLAFVAVLVPVAVDNAAQHGQLSVTTSSYGGWGIYVGASQEAGGRFNEADAERLRTLPGETLRARSDEAGRLGIQRIRDDPTGFAQLALRKQVGLWGDDGWAVFYALDWQADPRPAAGLLTFGYISSQISWAFVSLAAAWGMLRTRRPMPAWLLATVLLVASLALLHAVVEVQPRYHAYVTPLILGVAAMGLVGRPREEGRSRAAGPASVDGRA